LLALPVQPLVIRGVPLSKALDEIGVGVGGGYVLFGVEQRLRKHQPPLVSLDFSAGTTLGGALREVVRQAPDYQFRVVSSHLINVYPAGADQDPDNILNTVIAQVEVFARPGLVLSRPADFIPELKNRLLARSNVAQPRGTLGEVLEGSEAPIRLALKNVSVRQVLNAVSQEWAQSPEPETPAGWIYSYDPEATSPTDRHLWSFQFSLARDWRKWRD
jgi:hypothetical protein